mgnify:CR=1 FL=1
MRLIFLLQFVVLVAAVLSCVALIVAAWVGTGALAGAAALLGVTSCRSAAAWVRATAIWAVARSSWSADVHVGFALLDGLDDCSLSATAGYEVELCIGNEVLFTERMVML